MQICREEGSRLVGGLGKKRTNGFDAATRQPGRGGGSQKEVLIQSSSDKITEQSGPHIYMYRANTENFFDITSQPQLLNSFKNFLPPI